jgi:hypothetical protein
MIPPPLDHFLGLEDLAGIVEYPQELLEYFEELLEHFAERLVLLSSC